MKPLLVALTAIALSLTAAAGNATAAAAEWYVSPTGSDLNVCTAPALPCATINGAIGKASDGDTVKVAVGTYTGSGASVVIVDRAIVLEGGWNPAFTARTGVSKIDGQGARRGIVVAGAAARIERFLIDHGAVPQGFPAGGGILVGGPGGAIGAQLVLDASTVRNSQPGGLWSEGPLVVTNSTFSGNSSNNTGAGGGITAFGATLSVRNSTVSGNTAPDGGGILVSSDLVAQLSNVTIVGNSASTGGGITVTSRATLHLRNSIVAGNADADISGGFPAEVISDGYNIGTGFTHSTGDLFPNRPLVAALADEGGPTETRALLVHSAALDAGNPAGCKNELGGLLLTDQRGLPRPLRHGCDIGAYEAKPPENDGFANATSLEGLTSPISGRNKYASTEHGEPEHALSLGGASIWYSWTPQFSGMAYVSTAGSAIDSLVGVYSGSSVAFLTTLAGNDDATTRTGTSMACFEAVAGTRYYIAVDGYGAAAGLEDAEGNVSLTWGRYASTDPCAILPPVINGRPQALRRLTATSGTWAGARRGFKYQWFACAPSSCFAIPGASAATYTPPWQAKGFSLFVLVAAIGASANSPDAISRSAPTVPLAPASPCRVPALRGKLLSLARKRIVAAHCSVGGVRYAHSRLKRGAVIAQTPRAGKVVRAGTRVNLVVSRGR